MKISDRFKWQCLTPEPGHYFFGYYDRCPWNNDNSMHLSLRVGQCERLPRQGETADVGYVSPEDNGFVKLAETRAWCHQQGSMTQWLKHRPDTFVYNDYDPATNRVFARIYELGKGIAGHYELPIYIISPDGRWAISLNFSRLPRRGYSYADVPIPAERHPDLDNDGIFLMDLHSGVSRLLVSYRDIIARHPLPYSLDAKYWWLDHPGVNCDSSQILFLFRDCENPFEPYPWRTNMFTMDLNGSGLNCILPDFYWRNSMISHQLWGRTPHEVLVDANWQGRGHEYVVFDHRIAPVIADRISEGMGPMGHLIFSPDRQWLLADTYPDERHMQRLAVVHVKSGKYEVIGEFKHEQSPETPVDLRCDLHPRWSADGKRITVDSINGGKRNIYMHEFNSTIFEKRMRQ